MDPAHRDRIAFIRVCSGRFERGMVLTHAGTGRPFTTKYAQQVCGRDRHTVDVAYPGDIVGMVNATALGVGETLYVEQPVSFPPIPSFAPEHFAVLRPADASRYKQFRRGVRQLDEEGVVQVSPQTGAGNRRRCSPRSDPCSSMSCCTGCPRSSPHPPGWNTCPTLWPATPTGPALRYWSPPPASRCSSATGVLLALFPDRWRLATIQWDQPDTTLESLIAGTTDA